MNTQDTNYMIAGVAMLKGRFTLEEKFTKEQLKNFIISQWGWTEETFKRDGRSYHKIIWEGFPSMR